MRTRLRHLWDTFTSSLWFVPALMTVIALCAALGSLRLDRSPLVANWAYGGGPEGAREVLSAVAASMITVAGVSFSVMIVALTLASQQFGPRLLRNFMRDTGNQIVLGTFIATFTYCLIVLRTIHSNDADFVPHISVTLAIVLALASLGVLIYFIHHAAVSIQAPELIATVSRDLAAGIDRLFPEQLGQSADEDNEPAGDQPLAVLARHGHTISANGTGYLQSIADDRLMSLAREKELVVALKCRPGDFIISGDALAEVYPPESVDDPTAQSIRSAFVCGTQRTHLQDVEFTLQQLVEVAVRALSPGINDPFTAINCIDRITAGLCSLAGRAFPSASRRDEDGALRVIAPRSDFGTLLEAAFDPIRQYGRSSAPVTVRLLDSIGRIARHAKRAGDRAALLEQAKLIARGSHDGLPEEADRARVEEHFRRAIQELRNGPSDKARDAVATT